MIYPVYVTVLAIPLTGFSRLPGFSLFFSFLTRSITLEKSHSEEIVEANTEHDSVTEDRGHYTDNIFLDDKSFVELTEKYGKTSTTRGQY